MAFSDRDLLEDLSGVKIPQYDNPTLDAFEPVEGENGAWKVRIEDGHDVTGGTKADPVAGADLTQEWTRASLLKAAVERLREISTIQGSTWHVGTGAPASGLGSDGDFYLDESNGDFYKKDAGAWSLEGNIAGPQGPAGPSAAMNYDFATETAEADPGPGTFRLDNADPSLAFEMYIDDLDADGANVRAYIQSWAQSTTPSNKGYLSLRSVDNPGKFAIYRVTSIGQPGGYLRVNLAYVDHDGTFAAGEAIGIGFARTGDQGSGASTLTISVDNANPTTSQEVTFTIAGDTADLSIWWLEAHNQSGPLGGTVNESGTTQAHTFSISGETHYVTCVASDGSGGALPCGIVKVVVQ